MKVELQNIIGKVEQKHVDVLKVLVAIITITVVAIEHSLYVAFVYVGAIFSICVLVLAGSKLTRVIRDIVVQRKFGKVIQTSFSLKSSGIYILGLLAVIFLCLFAFGRDVTAIVLGLSVSLTLLLAAFDVCIARW